ncbi:MAG: hypothetical protein IH946_09790, partial [Bacteroidetes bacterium]|nr:hypothetical protein [Bacteroidota bacterium]
MKRITLLLALTMCVTYGYSQYYYIPFLNSPGNPGGLNTLDEYPVGGGLDPSWNSIHVGPASSPEWSTTETIPFTFNFNGTAVTQYKASSSGVLTFDVSAVTVPSYTNASLPDTSIPDKSIMVWGLEASSGNDNIVTQTFGTAGSRQHWIFFSSYNLPGGDLTTCWIYWSIVLEEGTDNIYIVDQRKDGNGGCTASLSVGIQLDNATAFDVTGTPLVTSLAGTDASDADNNYYQFTFGTQAVFDLTVTNIDMQTDVLLSDGPFEVKGTIENWGSSDLFSYDLNYTVDGGTTEIFKVVTNVLSGTSHDFTHGTDWMPPAEGTYNIEIWATKLNNNNPDENTANDKLDIDIVVDILDYDLTALSIDLPSTIDAAEGPFAIEGQIDNLGSETITYLTLNYKVNGGLTVAAIITNISIPLGGTYNYSHPITWDPQSTGSHTIELWASGLNGFPDDVTSNDVVAKTVTVTGNVGIEELENVFDISLYPNPAQEQFNVVLSLEERMTKVSMEVHNILGVKVMEIPVNNYSNGKHTITINTSSLP